MKKLFAAIMSAALVLSVSACAKQEGSGSGNSNRTESASSEKPDNTGGANESEPNGGSSENEPDIPEEPTGPAADEDDFETSHVDGGVEIKYIAAGGDVVIPSKIGGENVAALASYAFSDCENLGRVTVPRTVTTIGHGAFWNSGLTEVVIPDSVVEIEDLAFKSCVNLTSIKLPKDLTVIGDDMFSGCEALEGVTLPDGLTDIGTNAFSNCKRLKDITLPDSVAHIETSAFWNCYEIKVSYKGKTYDYAGINDLYGAVNG